MQESVDGLLRDKSRPPGKAQVPPERVAEIVRLTQEPPLAEAGLLPSVGSVGDSCDNASAETIDGTARPGSSGGNAHGQTLRHQTLRR